MSSPLIREELVRQDAVRDLVKYRIWLIAFSQVTLIACSYYFSFLLRLDIPLDGASRLLFWETIPIVLVIKLLVFYRFGLLRGWWRYVGMSDVADIAGASFLSAGAQERRSGYVGHIAHAHISPPSAEKTEAIKHQQFDHEHDGYGLPEEKAAGPIERNIQSQKKAEVIAAGNQCHLGKSNQPDAVLDKVPNRVLADKLFTN